MILAIIRMVVDLPEPFGPINPNTAPSATDSESRSTAFTDWNALLTVSISTANTKHLRLQTDPRPQTNPRPQTKLMSELSSTRFPQPCLATLSIARPICWVVVTYLGKRPFKSGSNGP